MSKTPTRTSLRRSRFFTVIFLCLKMALWCSPRLVTFFLCKLPNRFAGERFRLAIGNSLFQLDYPAEALRYLEQSSYSDKLSIDEYLLRAMCLFQGLGRFDDAVSLLARANEANIKEAEKYGLDPGRFRVLDRVWARHIGHTATLDYVVKLAILEGRNHDGTLLYVPPGEHIANRFLLDQMATQLQLIERPADLPFDAAAIPALRFDYLGPRLPNGKTAYFWELAGRTYKRWEQEGRGALLTLLPEMEKRGRAVLQEAGVPQDAWFVALHIREGKWNHRNAGLHGILNAEVPTYLPAISAITQRGGWVVRMGDAEMTPLPSISNLVDYSHSTWRSDWMDVFIAARCRFLLGTSSGPAYIPSLYGVPSVLTNWWPPAQRPWHASDIFVPKLLRRLADRRYLTLSETLSEPFSYCHSRKFLAQCGVIVEDTDPTIILAAVEEMLERLDGKAGDDTTAAELSSRADRIYGSHHAFGGATLAREFLRRHHGLIV